MKLDDLKRDAASVTQQLSEKYNVDVIPDLRLNQENLNEVLLTFRISTTLKPVETKNVVDVSSEEVTKTETVESNLNNESSN